MTTFQVLRNRDPWDYRDDVPSDNSRRVITHRTSVSSPRDNSPVDRCRETGPASSNNNRNDNYGIARCVRNSGKLTDAKELIRFPASKAGPVRTMPYWWVQREDPGRDAIYSKKQTLVGSNKVRVASCMLRSSYRFSCGVRSCVTELLPLLIVIVFKNLKCHLNILIPD